MVQTVETVAGRGRWHGWVSADVQSMLDPGQAPQCYPPNPGQLLPLATYCSPGIWPISCLRTRSSLPENWGTL